jgi:hypothetical protein
MSFTLLMFIARNPRCLAALEFAAWSEHVTLETVAS